MRLFYWTDIFAETWYTVEYSIPIPTMSLANIR